MVEKIHPQLEGRKLLIVDSKYFAYKIASYLKELERMDTYPYEDVPVNLLEIMNNKNIQLAIIHATLEWQIQPIIEAHQNGKGIVVLQRTYGSIDDNIYKKLAEFSVPLVQKVGGFQYEILPKSLDILDLYIKGLPSKS